MLQELADAIAVLPKDGALLSAMAPADPLKIGVEVVRDLALQARRPPGWPDWQTKLHERPARSSTCLDEDWPKQRADASFTAAVS